MVTPVIHGVAPVVLGMPTPFAGEMSAMTAKVVGHGRTHMLKILEVEFVSDHQVLLNSESLLTSDLAAESAPRFAKPEWVAMDDSFAIEDRPISHSMDEKIKLKVRVKFVAPRSLTIHANLVGLLGFDPLGNPMILFEARDLLLHGGKVESFEMTSASPIPAKVQRIELSIHWQLLGERIESSGHGSTRSVIAPPRQSKHEIYATMSKPSTLAQFPGVSVGRLRHAIEQVSPLWNRSSVPTPRDIVEHLMDRFSERFELSNNVADPWMLSDPTVNADCISICEYVLSVLKLVGCEGNITPVLVYEKLTDMESWGQPGHFQLEDDQGRKVRRPALFVDRTKWDPTAADFVAAEETVTRGQLFGGLANPVICEWDPTSPADKPRALSFVTLSTDGFDRNSFEACLKFTHAGETIYFPGGISPRVDGKFAFTPGEVLRRTFRHLRWRGVGSLDGTLIKKYE